VDDREAQTQEAHSGGVLSMKREEARSIIDEARQDRRLDAELDSRWTLRHKNAYHVKLTLRKFQTSITAKRSGDWQEIKQLWKDL
jgi:hypothetical protein